MPRARPQQLKPPMRTPDRDKLMQFVRFCIVGTVAAAIHYGVYYLMQLFL